MSLPNKRKFSPSLGLARSSRDQINSSYSNFQQEQMIEPTAKRHFSSRYVNLFTNAYKLKFSSSPRTIYDYQLKVSVSEGHKDIAIEVLSKNFVARSIRKILMETIIPKLLDAEQTKSVVIETDLEAIYTLHDFKLNDVGCSKTSSPKTFRKDFIFTKIPVKTDLLKRLFIDVELKYRGSFSSPSNELNLILMRSILHHKLLINMIQFGSVYYDPCGMHETGTKEERLDLISQQIMGISLSGVKQTFSNQNLIVINCPYSYITQTHRLIDLLATFISGQPTTGVTLTHTGSSVHKIHEVESINGTEEWFLSYCSILNGFKCTAIGSDERIKLRFQLTEKSAANLEMQETKTTVEEFYRIEHGIILTYPNLPCLYSKTNYYPLELCAVMPYQKVPIFRLSTNARFHLSALNKPKPDLAKLLSNKARDKVVLLNRDIFQNFGLELSHNPVETRGFKLSKPTLRFHDKEFNPLQDYWNSGQFYHAKNLIGNWCIVNTVAIDLERENYFFREFSSFCKNFGFFIKKPHTLNRLKQDLLDCSDGLDLLIDECRRLTKGRLEFVMFIIDSSSTSLNRLIHLSFDEYPSLTATCLRVESIMNQRKHKSIFRTLVHKLNARLGGCNVTFTPTTMAKLNMETNDLMVVGLDVTHPDNELDGVSIVGCAYTYSNDLFKHRSLVWPQAARTEIINKMDLLVKQLLYEYFVENQQRLPKQLIIYRDGVSQEEFERVRAIEVSRVQQVLNETGDGTDLPKPGLSYIIAQKRHTMRFFQKDTSNAVINPPSGTLINQDVVSHSSKEFYLYSNTSPHATARPLHYHVLQNGIPIDKLQELTYILCFNFGKCSGTLSMPSSLKYAHNAAYDARNRVINSREFSESKFYTSKFFC